MAPSSIRSPAREAVIEGAAARGHDDHHPDRRQEHREALADGGGLDPQKPGREDHDRRHPGEDQRALGGRGAGQPLDEAELVEGVADHAEPDQPRRRPARERRRGRLDPPQDAPRAPPWPAGSGAP